MATAPHPRSLAAARIDWQPHGPVARDYGDLYFSRQDGARETREVFLAGNGLPARWHGRENRRFVIGELGFGTGLNFTVTRAAFLAEAPSHLRLHYVAFERHPLGSRDLATFAGHLGARWPDLAGRQAELAAAWPPRLAGWHRRSFDGGRVQLSLWLGDAGDGVDDWLARRRDATATASVDAWFLDGFAPDRNPALWDADLLRRLAALSAPEATVATFSVARRVRDGLTAAGFEVTRVPGSGGKRQVLRGVLGRRPAATHAPTAGDGGVAVIGAGLAGAWIARLLHQAGHRVTVLDARGPARGASGNPWAVLHPRLPLDDGLRGPLLASAWTHAVQALAAFSDGGPFRPAPVLQFPPEEQPDRMRRIAGRYVALEERIGLETIAGLEVLRFADGGHGDLPAIIAALLADLPVDRTRISGFEATDGGWRLAGEASGTDGFAHVVVATGAAGADLLPQLPLVRMRGQLDRFRGRPRNGWPGIVTGRGHLVPLDDGCVVGSSYVRDGPAGPTTAAESADNAGRLRAWNRLLGATDRAGETPVAAFSGQRCHVPDRAPVAGSLAPGLHVCVGLGSAGLTLCPLLAAFLTDRIDGGPPVLDRDIEALIAPGRPMRR